MHPVLLTAGGLALLAFFLFGGRVQGRGDRAYVASAARAFVLPWCMLVLGNLWLRWWSGFSPLQDALPSLGAVVVPIAAAFLLWRRFRSGP